MCDTHCFGAVFYKPLRFVMPCLDLDVCTLQNGWQSMSVFRILTTTLPILFLHHVRRRAASHLRWRFGGNACASGSRQDPENFSVLGK